MRIESFEFFVCDSNFLIVICTFFLLKMSDDDRDIDIESDVSSFSSKCEKTCVQFLLYKNGYLFTLLFRKVRIQIVDKDILTASNTFLRYLPLFSLTTTNYPYIIYLMQEFIHFKAEKRAHHNALERKRRDHIKDSFSSLREAVPSLQSEKVASRAQILKKAAEYIQNMRRKNASHQQDIDDLKRQNNLLETQSK